MSVPYTRTSSSISLVLNFTSQVIPKSHPNFQKIADALAKGATEADLKPLLDIPAAVSTFTGGNVAVVDGRLFYKGFEVKGDLAKEILDFVKSGPPGAAKPFEMFLEKAFQNPDPRAAQDLYSWVAASGLPITETGDILAWKAVGNDYRSIHTGPRGKLDHSIGKVVEEPRHETDADPNSTCSRGIHFCSADYLKHYASGGSRVVAVTISPTDVVAFPKDYGNSKGRACRLTVVGEVPHDKVREYYPQGAKTYSWQQRWIRRDGSEVTIVETNRPGAYPLGDDQGNTYTRSGFFAGEGTQSKFDLIRRV